MSKKRWAVWSVIAVLALVSVTVLSGGRRIAPAEAQGEGVELAVYNQDLDERLRKGKPLTYAHYYEVKKGKASKNAPTYRGDIEKKQEKPEDRREGMQKYVCEVCGYIYDPAQGDPDGGVAPGTAFDALPDDWVCPVCGAGKDQFSPES